MPKEKISKHFYRHEVACKCGCGFDTMDGVTLALADECRDFVRHPIKPTSGARCAVHNAAEKGTKHSQHLKGRAMDLPTLDPEGLYNYLCNKYPDQYGFGLYRTFVHIDSRTNGPARWKGEGI